MASYAPSYPVAAGLSYTPGRALLGGSGNPAWLNGTVMRWSPPALTNPTIVAVPTGFASLGTFGDTEDVLLVMPASARGSDFQCDGGRNIRVIGGENNGGGSGSRMIFSSVTGSVFIEGVKFTMGKVEDVLNVQGKTGFAPDVYLQNICEAGAAGQLATNHTDFWQVTAGAVGKVHIHRATFDSNYQGIFDPVQFPQTSTDISLVNARYNAVTPADSITYLLWFGTTDSTAGASSGAKAASIIPRALTKVYVDMTGRSGTLATTGVWPATGETINGVAVGAIADGSGNVTWPAAMGITGGVTNGSPAVDFCPSTVPGVSYSQPGYADGTVLPGTASANTAVPTISGTPTQGQTLTATSGTWNNSPISYSYQWKRGGVAIAGARSLTYALVSADVGSTITVTVAAYNGARTANFATSTATAAVAGLFNTYDFTGGTLPSGTSFTRASTAVYSNSASAAAINTARFENGGVLIEYAGTNLFAQPNFASGWTAEQATKTANAVTGPDGTTDASSALETATTNNHGILSPTLTISTQSYVKSVHAKPVNGRLAVIGESDLSNAAYFQFFTLSGAGTVNSNQNVAGSPPFTGVTAAIAASSQGFYRISIATTPPTGRTSEAIRFGSAAVDGTSTFLGVTADGVDLYGGQLEVAGSGYFATHPTSYMPSGSRSADALVITSISAGAGHVVVTFDDNSTQTISATAGSPLAVPTNLNRPWIKTITETA